MPFLVLADYEPQIQQKNLDAITEGVDARRLDCEFRAIEEATSYLKQRFNTLQAFLDYSIYTTSGVYSVSNDFTAASYNPLTEYAIGSIISVDGYIYYSLQASKGISVAYDKYWLHIGYNNRIYLTATAWVAGVYSVGSLVSNLGKVFVCIQTTTNEPTTNVAFWTEIGKNNTFYYVIQTTTAGIYPNNSLYFKEGDTRSKQSVTYLIDIALYHLHSRINPMNIPVLRHERYDGNGNRDLTSAISWLRAAGKGLITINLPVLQPEQGIPISYGSQPKLTNNY